MQPNYFEEIIEEPFAGQRLDACLAERIDDVSRSVVKRLIKEGYVTVNGARITRPSRVLAAGDRVEVELPPPSPTDLVPEDIPLDVLHEDGDLVVVNKPSGMVVHPAPGHASGTLVNAILHRCPDFACPSGDAARPGIVHRLDRFTSGVLVVAKTERALASLSEQAREHAFDRRYLALARGEFPEERGLINASVGRSIADRKRMSVTGVNSREAVTRFEMIERFGVACLVALQLETGRTHQIRVHLRFAGHPVLGDPVYGVSDFANWPVTESLKSALAALEGQALHAGRLGFRHPATGEFMTFTAPPPGDFATALDALRRFATPPAPDA